MKYKFRNLLLLAMTSFLLVACQEDPAFPDPGFDFTSDKIVEVRRDTADYYDIAMNMNVLNGVDKIEVLNGLNYDLIESIADYKGQTKFEFKYRVDFSEINVDTTLNFIIKVVDKDARSFNRGMTIRLKKFSIPEILTSGGDHLNIATPVFLLRSKISTGMNYIDSIKISYEGDLVKVIVPAKQISDTIISELITVGSLEWDRDYHLIVSVTDNKGQRTDKNIIILRKDLQKPRSVSYYDGGIFQGTWNFEYDDQNRLVDMVWDYTRIKQTYKYKFTYNELGMVSQIAWEYYYAFGGYYNYYYDRFYYKENSKQLDYMTTQNEKKYDTGAFVSNPETKMIENIVYNENGTIKSFVSGANLLDNISYNPGFSKYDWVFAEYWYTPYAAIKTQYRQRRVDYQPVFMPTYIEGLPPFSSETGYIKTMFNNLFMQKYIYGKNERISDPSYDKNDNYAYETDSEGRITKIIRSYYNVFQWSTSEYRLNY